MRAFNSTCVGKLLWLGGGKKVACDFFKLYDRVQYHRLKNINNAFVWSSIWIYYSLNMNFKSTFFLTATSAICWRYISLLVQHNYYAP